MIQDDTNDYIASLIQVINDITRGLPEARSQQDIAPVYEQSYVFSSRPIPPTLACRGNAVALTHSGTNDKKTICERESCKPL